MISEPALRLVVVLAQKIISTPTFTPAKAQPITRFESSSTFTFAFFAFVVVGASR
jgi:hypothetical protein